MDMNATMTHTPPIPPDAAAAPAAGTIAQPTDPIEAQVQALKLQLRHAQKMACLGTTSAMLAHEYNNILAPVISYAQYALDRNDVPLMRKTLETVLKQFSAVQAMSDRVLGFARQDAAKTTVFNLRRMLEETVGCLCRDLAKDNITLKFEGDESIEVKGDADALQQVFFNLVLNARQALIEKKGTLKITVTPLPDSRVMIHVRDSGCGIRPENLERVFDAFFSTKAEKRGRDRKGIGLGLAICKDIIEEHGGCIDVESIEGHGTTFTVTLPTAS